MLELLKMDLQNKGQHDVLVDHTAFALLLTTAYEDQENYTSNQNYAWLRKRGEDLATGQKSSLVTIVNQNSNHWIGTIIDFKAMLGQLRTAGPNLAGDPKLNIFTK